MANQIDLFRIKVDKARAGLSEETRNAIDAVNWKVVILGMRESKGYTFEQLGDLEIETELLLAGLITPNDYPKELQSRMGISRTQANELVNEMNDLVFKKIREKLIQNIESKKQSRDTYIPTESKPPVIINESTTKPKISKEASNNNETHPILAQKLFGSFQIPKVETEHSLDNITKTNTSIKATIDEIKADTTQNQKSTTTSYPPKGDPYRLSPDE